VNEDSAPKLLQALHRVLDREDLDAGSAEGAMSEIMAGQASEGRIGGYLCALRMKGETAEEIVGSARALRAAATTIAPSRRPLLDTCGTGGDDSGTFNISTASALVVAAAGVAVAKHGNRSVSSQCGSADVLREMGLPVDADPDHVCAMVERLGFGFLMAPRFHGAIKHAMPARITLATRTVFNLLGPLANPAGADRQVMGVFSESVLGLAAEALHRLGTERAFVLHSEDGLDEISIGAPTDVVEVGPTGTRRFRIAPEDFGFERAELSEIAGGNATENARILARLFEGETGPKRDIVLMNAAIALVAGGAGGDFREGAELAARAIDSGRVTALVDALRVEGS
jgi:anthranilate phosphoribosyltransferase